MGFNIKKIILKTTPVILAIFVLSWFFVLRVEDDAQLEIISLDVGQGDAILIKTPKNQTMLVDGGPNNKVLQKLGKYLTVTSKKIDIILLTHPHADHVTGLIEVSKRYDIGAVILNGSDLKTDAYYEFLKVIKEKNIPVMIAEFGEAIHFDKNLEFDVLAPTISSNIVFNKQGEGFGSAGNDVNDTSIVGKLIFDNFSMIFMGDATYKIENQLLAYGENLKSDILKVGHHGSKFSSLLSFLNAVSPKAAIIEVGAKNRYGHPATAALSRLKMIDAEVFRTDLNGDIKIISDGFITKIFKEK